MNHSWQAVHTILQTAVPGTTPAAQLVILQAGQPVFAQVYGWLDLDTRQRPTQPDTLFDLASVTKLFVATTFLRLVEAGQVTLDQPVQHVLPNFVGERPIHPYEDPLRPGAWVEVAPGGGTVEPASVTFRHLLTHTAGLAAWRPLFRQADPAAARELALHTFFSYRPGERVSYSDIGLILLGLAVEQLTGLSLAEAMRTQVTEPLGLRATRYLPRTQPQPEPPVCAPTEFCAWRQYRVVGEVHDENAAFLGGVSGHAGLFSTAHEVATFGQSFLDATLLRADTIAEMTRPQAVDGDVRRGLGFALWSPDPEANSHPFSPQTFGHTGFTGTSLWIDPERALVVALLTNEVYYGRQARGIGPLRVAVHRAIVEAVDGH